MPEVRRLILAMAGPAEEREFRLGWSMWRRAHQAVAKRCHAAKRLARGCRAPDDNPARSAATAAPAKARAAVAEPLTDAEWGRVKPLLPPQKPPVGRPRRDQRVVLDGILWVLGTGSSWRDVPRERFGPWETVYGRYREWRKEGLWRRVLEALERREGA